MPYKLFHQEIASFIRKSIKNANLELKLKFLYSIAITGESFERLILDRSRQVQIDTFECISKNTNFVGHLLLQYVDASLPRTLTCHCKIEEKIEEKIAITYTVSLDEGTDYLGKIHDSFIKISEDKTSTFDPVYDNKQRTYSLVCTWDWNEFKKFLHDMDMKALFTHYAFLYFTWDDKCFYFLTGSENVREEPIERAAEICSILMNSVAYNTHPHAGAMLNNLFASNPLLQLVVNEIELPFKTLILAPYHKQYAHHMQRRILSGKIEKLDGTVAITVQDEDGRSLPVFVKTQHLDWNKLLGFISVDEAKKWVDLLTEKAKQQENYFNPVDLMRLINVRDFERFNRLMDAKPTEFDQSLIASWSDYRNHNTVEKKNYQSFQSCLREVIFKGFFEIHQQQSDWNVYDRFVTFKEKQARLFCDIFEAQKTEESKGANPPYRISIKNNNFFKALPFIKECITKFFARLERKQALLFCLEKWKQSLPNRIEDIQRQTEEAEKEVILYRINLNHYTRVMSLENKSLIFIIDAYSEFLMDMALKNGNSINRVSDEADNIARFFEGYPLKSFQDLFLFFHCVDCFDFIIEQFGGNTIIKEKFYRILTMNVYQSILGIYQFEQYFGELLANINPHESSTLFYLKKINSQVPMGAIVQLRSLAAETAIKLYELSKKEDDLKLALHLHCSLHGMDLSKAQEIRALLNVYPKISAESIRNATMVQKNLYEREKSKDLREDLKGLICFWKDDSNKLRENNADSEVIENKHTV